MSIYRVRVVKNCVRVVELEADNAADAAQRALDLAVWWSEDFGWSDPDVFVSETEIAAPIKPST